MRSRVAVSLLAGALFAAFALHPAKAGIIFGY